jgi:S1-C subfamily serine protease
LLGGEVVGINTSKQVDVDVEGIGFALHYLEIARFITAYQASR